MAERRKETGSRILEVRNRPVQAINDVARSSGLPKEEAAYYQKERRS